MLHVINQNNLDLFNSVLYSVARNSDNSAVCFSERNCFQVARHFEGTKHKSKSGQAIIIPALSIFRNSPSSLVVSLYLAIIAVNRDDRGESRSRQWCRRRARFMGLQMLTVNLRQTSGRRGEIRPDTHAVRAYNAQVALPRRVRAVLHDGYTRASSPRNSLSFRRLSHKFNNLVVRKYRPVSPVFARRSRSDCSPRAASIEHALVPLPRRWAKALFDEIAVLFRSPKLRRAAEIIAPARAAISR